MANTNTEISQRTRCVLFWHSGYSLDIIKLLSTIILVSISYSCSSTIAGPKDIKLTELNGQWKLVKVNSVRISPISDIYFTISNDSITGYDGCNKFAGRITSPNTIRKGQRGCGNANWQLPLDLKDPWPQLESSTLKEDRLLLPLKNKIGFATFERFNLRK